MTRRRRFLVAIAAGVSLCLVGTGTFFQGMFYANRKAMNNDESEDSARDITALDCKSDPQKFERLLHYFIKVFGRRYDLTRVPEDVPRAALRKAINKVRPGANYRFANYAYWWVRQGITRHLADSKDGR